MSARRYFRGRLREEVVELRRRQHEISALHLAIEHARNRDAVEHERLLGKLQHARVAERDALYMVSLYAERIAMPRATSYCDHALPSRCELVGAVESSSARCAA